MKMPGNSHIFGLIVSHMGQNGQGMVFNGEFRERESCGRSQQVVLLDECSDFRKTVNPMVNSARLRRLLMRDVGNWRET